MYWWIYRRKNKSNWGGKSMVRNNAKVKISDEIANIVEKYIAVVKEN